MHACGPVHMHMHAQLEMNVHLQLLASRSDPEATLVCWRQELEVQTAALPPGAARSRATISAAVPVPGTDPAAASPEARARGAQADPEVVAVPLEQRDCETLARVNQSDARGPHTHGRTRGRS
jgi:hypothetical protein